MDNSLTYATSWLGRKYVERKQECFEMVDRWLPSPQKRILDIGCGYAKVSELFQKKYNCDLWLLDGDIDNSPGSRIGKWGSVDTFQFYLPLTRLRQQWDAENLRYHCVDASDIHIDSNITFDLVYSWVSCGFHYPVSVYKNLIQQHTNDDSVIIMEFRSGTIDQQIHDFDIVHTFTVDDKKQCHQIKFK